MRSNKFVTITKANYEAYAEQLANAQEDAGNSVLTVLGSLYRMRERVFTKFASDWKTHVEVKKMCMLATESLLVDFCYDFNYMIQDLKHNS